MEGYLWGIRSMVDKTNSKGAVDGETSSIFNETLVNKYVSVGKHQMYKKTLWMAQLMDCPICTI